MMSSFNASESGSQSNIIVNLILRFIKIDNISLLSVIVRKTAHFIEYFVLGILSLNCIKNYTKNKIVIMSLIFCIICASLDEFHQVFVPGRAGALKDVLIDSLGALSGIILFYYFKIKKVINHGE